MIKNMILTSYRISRALCNKLGWICRKHSNFVVGQNEINLSHDIIVMSCGDHIVP